MSFLQLATVDGRRVDGASEAPPGPPVPVETMRFLSEMRRMHHLLGEAAKAAALLSDEGDGNPAVAEGLALKVARDLSMARKANLEAQRLVPHVIGLVFVEVGPSDPDPASGGVPDRPEMSRPSAKDAPAILWNPL